jgi:hypothetical protein
MTEYSRIPTTTKKTAAAVTMLRSMLASKFQRPQRLLFDAHQVFAHVLHEGGMLADVISNLRSLDHQTPNACQNGRTTL